MSHDLRRRLDKLERAAPAGEWVVGPCALPYADGSLPRVWKAAGSPPFHRIGDDSERRARWEASRREAGEPAGGDPW